MFGKLLVLQQTHGNEQHQAEPAQQGAEPGRLGVVARGHGVENRQRQGFGAAEDVAAEHERNPHLAHAARQRQQQPAEQGGQGNRQVHGEVHIDRPAPQGERHLVPHAGMRLQRGLQGLDCQRQPGDESRQQQPRKGEHKIHADELQRAPEQALAPQQPQQGKADDHRRKHQRDGDQRVQPSRSAQAELQCVTQQHGGRGVSGQRQQGDLHAQPQRLDRIRGEDGHAARLTARRGAKSPAPARFARTAQSGRGWPRFRAVPSARGMRRRCRWAHSYPPPAGVRGSRRAAP